MDVPSGRQPCGLASAERTGVPHDEPGRTGGKLRACGKEVHEHKRGDGRWSDECWALGKGQSDQCGRGCL